MATHVCTTWHHTIVPCTRYMSHPSWSITYASHLPRRPLPHHHLPRQPMPRQPLQRVSMATCHVSSTTFPR
jgi:hypothetical protein